MLGHLLVTLARLARNQAAWRNDPATDERNAATVEKSAEMIPIDNAIAIPVSIIG